MIITGCAGFPVSHSRYYNAFSCIEINSTFYNLPRQSTADRWKSEAAGINPGFEFIVKAWQLITHTADSPTYRRLRHRVSGCAYGSFRPTQEVFQAWEKTRDVAVTLGAKKILFQCPAAFTPSPENISNMRRFFSGLHRGNLVLIWEPRGEWDLGLIRQLCQELGLVHCVDPLSPSGTISQSGDLNYFRLHGRYYGGRIVYDHKFSDEELSKVLGMCGKPLNYVIFNNSAMLDDAERFCNLLH